MSAREAGTLEVYAKPDDLAAALADLFVDEARSAIAARGGFYVALAGGTTPKAAYQLLATPPRRTLVSWADVFCYFGDERCVPPSDEQSNYRMACKALLENVPIPPHNVHRMRGEGQPDNAAQSYAKILRDDLGENLAFDLLMLGMGRDGHTASLFPGEDPLTGNERLVRAPYVQKVAMHRLTVTPKIINASRHVAIATEGVAKAAALHSVREGPYNPSLYPIQIVAPLDGRLTWLVDRAAASQLTSSLSSGWQ